MITRDNHRKGKNLKYSRKSIRWMLRYLLRRIRILAGSNWNYRRLGRILEINRKALIGVAKLIKVIRRIQLIKVTQTTKRIKAIQVIKLPKTPIHNPNKATKNHHTPHKLITSHGQNCKSKEQNASQI
jgi:hypothetical protein